MKYENLNNDRLPRSAILFAKESPLLYGGVQSLVIDEEADQPLLCAPLHLAEDPLARSVGLSAKEEVEESRSE